MVNDAGTPVEGALEVEVIARGSAVTARAREPVTLPPRGSAAFDVDALLGWFLDLTYAYRFGPLGHEAVVARLTDPDGATLACDVYRPAPRPATPVAGLETSVAELDDGTVAVELTAPALLWDTRIEADGWRPEDAWLTLLPGRTRRIVLRRVDGFRGPFVGALEAENLTRAVRLAAGG